MSGPGTELHPTETKWIAVCAMIAFCAFMLMIGYGCAQQSARNHNRSDETHITSDITHFKP